MTNDPGQVNYVLSTSSARKILSTAVGAVCFEAGFIKVDEDAFETVVEMAQALLTEIGRNSKFYYELAGRTSPTAYDVGMALISMGLTFDSLVSYASRPLKKTLSVQALQKQNIQLRMLQSGRKYSPPPHIPDYMPPLPDPHTYISTTVYTNPCPDYQLLRMKSANQKRDMERALSRFMTRTAKKTHPLFPNETAFSLICQTATDGPTYMDALSICVGVPVNEFTPEDVEDFAEEDEKATQSGAIDNPYLRPIEKAKISPRKRSSQTRG